MNKLKERNIEQLWEKYYSLVKKLNDENILKLVESIDQIMVESSYSMKVSEPFCGIGGLVEYILEFTKNAKKINDTFELGIETYQLIKMCVLSEIGRCGVNGEKRYIEYNSDWHKEKLGQYFIWNDKIHKYKTSEMTIYYLNNFNIKLSWEEINAILLLNDFDGDLTKFYSDSKTNLATCLLFARDITLRKENNLIKLS